LCSDGFIDLIHHPKSKILKNIKKFKIKTTSFRKLALLPSPGEWRGRRVGVLFFFPSIHLKKEAEPASETS
jgi:hypothetical protein